MNIENELEQYYESTYSKDPNTIYVNEDRHLYAGDNKLIISRNGKIERLSKVNQLKELIEQHNDELIEFIKNNFT